MRPYWIGMENPTSFETRRNIKDVQTVMAMCIQEIAVMQKHAKECQESLELRESCGLFPLRLLTMSDIIVILQKSLVRVWRTETGRRGPNGNGRVQR